MSEWEEVLDFWFGQLNEAGEAAPEIAKRWFVGGPAFDEEVRERFLGTWEALVAGEKDDWLKTPRGRLAAIIVLDQLSRNMFRDTPKMYAEDDRAVALALDMIERGDDRDLPLAMRTFAYMPLMHAEDVAHQDRCIALFEKLRDELEGGPRERIENNLGYAHRHRDVVARFGRFPHRNAILGRETTPAEAAFLAEKPHGF